MLESKACRQWQASIRDYLRFQTRESSRGELWDEPIHLVLHFYLPPQQTRPRADTKPDLDKLVRAVMDALEGHLYTEDSRIVSLSCRKDRQRPTGVDIRACTLNGDSPLPQELPPPVRS